MSKVKKKNVPSFFKPVFAALLSAMIFLLTFTVGSLRFGPITITLNCLPVAIGAVFLGAIDFNSLSNQPINKRNIGTCIVLSIITLGLYFIFWEYLLVKNIRTLQKKQSSCTGEMLCLIFVPFYSLYWWYTRGKIVKDELSNYGYSATGNEIAYLLLGLFGLNIVSAAIMQNDFNALKSESIQSISSNNTYKPQRSFSGLFNYGAILGLVFGLCSFFASFTSASLTTIMLGINPFLTFVMCVLPRVICGWVPGLLFKALPKDNEPKRLVSTALCCGLTTVLNTIGFLGLMWLFFKDEFVNNGDVIAKVGDQPTGNIFLFIFALATINAVFEIVINLVFGTAICRALTAATKNKI